MLADIIVLALFGGLVYMIGWLRGIRRCAVVVAAVVTDMSDEELIDWRNSLKEEADD